MADTSPLKVLDSDDISLSLRLLASEKAMSAFLDAVDAAAT